MTDHKCRFGILGAANIARKNWQAILNSGNSTLTAVASRDPDRAEQFITECQGQVPFDPTPRATTYNELLASPDIDAVYIPLPTGLRKEWVEKAAAAGKHVLCEKPCAANATDLAEMIAVCHKHNVQFMDGVMFMHSQRLPAIRKVLDEGTSVGQLRRIASQFSFFGGEEFEAGNIRVKGDLEPLGCLGDLGWYTIRFTLWVLGYQMPTHVSGRILSSVRDSGVDIPLEFSAELIFDGGVSASFYNSFQTEHQEWAHVSGTKGSLYVPDFVLPHCGNEAGFIVSNPKFVADGCRFDMQDHSRRIAVPESSNNAPDSQETNMIRRFAELCLSGKPDPHWPEISLKTQQVMDACLASAHQGGETVKM
jgi:predicted dehydrogenase